MRRIVRRLLLQMSSHETKMIRHPFHIQDAFTARQGAASRGLIEPMGSAARLMRGPGVEKIGVNRYPQGARTP
jgi:hypothetical protein